MYINKFQNSLEFFMDFILFCRPKMVNKWQKFHLFKDDSFSSTFYFMEEFNSFFEMRRLEIFYWFFSKFNSAIQQKFFIYFHFILPLIFLKFFIYSEKMSSSPMMPLICLLVIFLGQIPSMISAKPIGDPLISF